jgi:hypothetical protein
MVVGIDEDKYPQTPKEAGYSGSDRVYDCTVRNAPPLLSGRFRDIKLHACVFVCMPPRRNEATRQQQQQQQQQQHQQQQRNHTTTTTS